MPRITPLTRDSFTAAAEHLARHGQAIDGAIILSLIYKLDGDDIDGFTADSGVPLVDQDDWFQAVEQCLVFAQEGPMITM